MRTERGVSGHVANKECGSKGWLGVRVPEATLRRGADDHRPDQGPRRTGAGTDGGEAGRGPDGRRDSRALPGRTCRCALQAEDGIDVSADRGEIHRPQAPPASGRCRDRAAGEAMGAPAPPLPSASGSRGPSRSRRASPWRGCSGAPGSRTRFRFRPRRRTDSAIPLHPRPRRLRRRRNGRWRRSPESVRRSAGVSPARAGR